MAPVLAHAGVAARASSLSFRPVAAGSSVSATSTPVAPISQRSQRAVSELPSTAARCEDITTCFAMQTPSRQWLAACCDHFSLLLFIGALYNSVSLHTRLPFCRLVTVNARSPLLNLVNVDAAPREALLEPNGAASFGADGEQSWVEYCSVWENAFSASQTAFVEPKDHNSVTIKVGPRYTAIR